jgi:para-aminobenzoate synthetase component 2
LKKVLVIDNYDSFTYNLVQSLGKLGTALTVVRNDQVSISDLESIEFDYLIISPGPGRPSQAGISSKAIVHFGLTLKVPVLGVCLGHQCISEVFGGQIIHAPYICHGKTSEITHNNSALFESIPNPFEATRYHSLVVAENNLPKSLEVIARTTDNIIMAVKHKELPIYGVQFHPESILTKCGNTLLSNFLNISSSKHS